MHVYLRDELVALEIREVDPEGLLPEEADLIAVAFYADGNPNPSFRALLPPETLAILEEALQSPVQLGLLAEEPDEGTEIQAMVGLSIPVDALPEGIGAEEGDDDEEGEELEPWQASSGSSEAWRGEDAEPEDGPRTVMLAFAPLVRLTRRFPEDFGEELADLLESALSGATKPALEARVDRMLGDF